MGRFSMPAIKAYLTEEVWTRDVDAMGFFARTRVQFLRFAGKTLFGFLDHSCALHAAGLTYYSLLAFVPVLCLLMVFAKTCGLDDYARREINGRIDVFVANLERSEAIAEASGEKVDEKARQKSMAAKALATQAREFSNDTFDRIDKFEVGTLGWVGLIMLMWTVISTLGQVETSMNEVWDVATPRPIVKRCVLFLLVAVVLPVLVAAALSMPVLRMAKAALDATLGATSYTKWAGDALVALVDSRLFSLAVAFVFASLAFAFLLSFLPHRKVALRPALEAGAVTTVLFWAWLRLCTGAGVGIAKSSALYGSFATVPIVLAWVYMSWQIVLLGSNIAYALQCVHYRSRDGVRA